METLFIGKNLLFLLEVESTNTYAMNLLRNVNIIEGTVVHTDNQTNGKGQRGSIWSSKIAQNITASVILKPQFLAAENAFYLSKISALAVYDVLAEILPNSQYDIKIKWPNDILVNKRKVAGILIENNFTNTSIQHAVIGIGLNVNQTEFDNLNNIASSIKLLINADYNRAEILEMLCCKMEKWYLKLKEQKMSVIDDAYKSCLYGINSILNFTDLNGVVFKGKVLGVSKKGKLMLELTDTVLKEFDIKEVKFIL